MHRAVLFSALGAVLFVKCWRPPPPRARSELFVGLRPRPRIAEKTSARPVVTDPPPPDLPPPPETRRPRAAACLTRSRCLSRKVTRGTAPSRLQSTARHGSTPLSSSVTLYTVSAAAATSVAEACRFRCEAGPWSPYRPRRDLTLS